MIEDNVITVNNQESATECVTDRLTALARQGAIQMLAKARAGGQCIHYPESKSIAK